MITVREPVICDTYTITAKEPDIAMRFGEDMPDSRLTEPSDGTVFCLREAIILSKKLGRPLTCQCQRDFFPEFAGFRFPLLDKKIY